MSITLAPSDTMLERLLGRSHIEKKADTLYGRAVEQARQPVFYTAMGVPDTVDGRFDMIALHVFLILHRLKRENKRTQVIAQALFDAMFTDMDRGLRELGAGDLGVGRRVKVMARAFYGRIAAYEQGLNAASPDLDEAVLRNIFRGGETNRAHAISISSYLREQAEALDGQAVDALLDGEIRFKAFGAGNGERLPS